MTALMIGVAGGASAAEPADTIRYHPPEAWILGPPTPVDTPLISGAPFQIVYSDNQIRVLADGTEEAYTAYRIKILKPEALPIGNVNLTWQPSNGEMTVHFLQLIRDGHTSDVLASNKFVVLQREEQLEQSMFTGQRTATLQVPGLQVGDEIAFGATVSRREYGFGGRVAGLMQMPVVGTPGAFRFRLLSPHDHKVELRNTNDIPSWQRTTSGPDDVAEVVLNNPKGATPTEKAPPRYNIRRLIEYSDFGSWTDVSRELDPLYEKAATLSSGSPLKIEAAAIASRTNDPVKQTEAALQLVQDRVRYVFVSLNGGNYVPASAEETWRRRFGDCKAKTVLLIALLRELGIQAEPAVVNSAGGDGADERLPGPRIFDHVIVRAIVAGKVQWLDGTRLGDRYLDNLPSPYRWALPLTSKGSELEKIAARDTKLPLMTELIEVDATAGIDKDAQVALHTIIRGDEAFALRTKIAILSTEDLDRALKGYWRQQIDWLTPDKVSWSYDERTMAISLDAIGRGNPGWKGEGDEDHSLTIPYAGFFPPDVLRRPSDQDQSASWSILFPRFRCSATTILLPKASEGREWSLYADPMNLRLGGVSFWRASGIDGKIVRIVMSTHSFEPEVSQKEAETVNQSIPKFNNNMSTISEVRASSALIPPGSTLLPFSDKVDWLNAPTPCFASE